jgi:hypothetical protein
MAGWYTECILYVKHSRHGDDVNCEVQTDVFILYSNYKYEDVVQNDETRREYF